MKTNLLDPVRVLARLKSRLPEVFTDGFAGLDGLGDRAIGAVASVFGRLRTRVITELRAKLIARATGGAHATGLVRVVWHEDTVHGYTVEAGNLLFRTRSGVRYVVAEPFTRTDSQAAGTAEVAVRAEYVGLHANLPAGLVVEWEVPADVDGIVWGGSTSADGKDEFLAGIGDGSITLDTTFDGELTGGLPGSLDLRAAGRGLPRAPGETDDDLRDRSRTVPDAVTPNGLQRHVAQALKVPLEQVIISEYWEHGFAWGHSGWGNSAWSQRLLFYVLIPPNYPVASTQSLVDRIKPAGVNAIVMARASI